MKKPIQADIAAAARYLGVDQRDIDPDDNALVDLLAKHREPRFARTADLIATGFGQGCGMVIGIAISLAVFAWWTA